MSHIEKEKLIKADIASIENRVRHAFNQGYDLVFKDGKEKAKPLEQETQTFKWCTDCKEYDQEKHCCHRWSKVIRDTVEEMKQEPRWIPCSEKLPKAEYGESDSVLVCFENETQDVLYFNGSNWCYPTGETYISVNHKNDWHNKVIAWMPLPKLFEPQESEDKE